MSRGPEPAAIVRGHLCLAAFWAIGRSNLRPVDRGSHWGVIRRLGVFAVVFVAGSLATAPNAQATTTNGERAEGFQVAWTNGPKGVTKNTVLNVVSFRKVVIPGREIEDVTETHEKAGGPALDVETYESQTHARPTSFKGHTSLHFNGRAVTLEPENVQQWILANLDITAQTSLRQYANVIEDGPDLFVVDVVSRSVIPASTRRFVDSFSFK